MSHSSKRRARVRRRAPARADEDGEDGLLAEKPQVLSRDVIGTIDRFIVRLQTEGPDSAAKLAALEELRGKLDSRDTIPFGFGEPGATVLWDLMEQDNARPDE